MPISLSSVQGEPRIVLEGVVSPEEVDQLHELLRDHPGAGVDLRACEHLHTAALQLLLLLKTPVAAPSDTPFWRHFFPQEEAVHEDDHAG